MTANTLIEDPLIGRQLANYRIERIISRGGMSQIYYGRDVKLQRPVAIKVIDARYRSNPTYAQRFVREAQSVAQWRHNNIIQIFYADDESGLFYYAMEYVDGMDLSQLLAAYDADGEWMPHRDVLHIGKGIAAGLDFAHEQGVIHRDVKPSNVMVSATGRVLIMDFGLALTVEDGSLGEIFGTPHYISPEQAHRSADAVPQSDLYSLGVILYEMLTGSVPFDDPSPTALALQHITDEPPPLRQINPYLNSATEAVVLKALRKEPEERYQSGKALMSALEKALETPAQEKATRPELPPIPAGIQSRTAGTVSHLSRLSVVERIALEVGENRTIPVRPEAEENGPGRQLWLAGGTLVALLLLVLLIWPRLDFGGPASAARPDAGMTATPAVVAAAGASPTLAATEAATSAPPATLPPPSPTPFPSATPTMTSMPPTSTPTPTNTPTPTPTRPVRRIQLFYDDAGFYVWNPDARPLDVAPLAFEAIDTAGNPAGYSFLGRSWTAFFPHLQGRACSVLEMESAVLTTITPFQCENINALMRIGEDAEELFWVSRPGVGHFTVYWEGNEIRTCTIAAGTCVFFAPDET